MIVTFHGYDASTLLKSEEYMSRLRELFKYAYVIAVSHEMHNKLLSLGVDKNKSSVVRCGIPIEKFLYKPRIPILDKMRQNQVIKFLQVSNFVEKKGHRYTLEAFNKVKNIYPNISLVFAGSGVLIEYIRKLVHQYNLSEYVEFKGKVKENEVSKLMYESDIFLHHSVTSGNGDKEGLPTVLMEAMATGLPCVSTYHAGIPELIKDGYNGYLIQEKDIDDYVCKIQMLLTSGNNFGKSSRETIEREFSLQISIERLVRLYNNLIVQ